MLRRSERRSGGTVGKNDDSDEAWQAEMHLRQDVPLPDGVALPEGTHLHVRRRDARKYGKSDYDGGAVVVMVDVPTDVSHKFKIKSLVTPAHKYDVDRSICSISSAVLANLQPTDTGQPQTDTTPPTAIAASRATAAARPATISTALPNWTVVKRRDMWV